MHQPAKGSGAVTDGRKEAVQRGQLAFGGNREDRATAVGPALGGCPPEIPVAGLDERRIGASTVGPATLDGPFAKFTRVVKKAFCADEAITAVHNKRTMQAIFVELTFVILSREV